MSVHRAIGFLVVLAAVAVACNDITRPIASVPDARRSYLTNPGGIVIVSPENMNGWSFIDDKTGTACTDQAVCSLVDGPIGTPSGRGSAELATPAAADAKALVLADYKGTRLDRITDLRYSTYRQSANAGNNVAIALQFNADYDLRDASVGYQGRLVFEPYQGYGGNVPDTTWQSWDAKAGKWWGTRASVPRGGVLTPNPCVQATPCTWAQLLAAFPDAGVHATYGAVYLKAGSGWAAFRGNVDELTIGVDGATTTFNFERNVVTVSALPPAEVPEWIYADSNFVSGGTTIIGELAKNVVMVAFAGGTPVSTRAEAISRVSGAVVGGIPIDDDGEGVYYVRPGNGSTPTEVLAAVSALAAAPGVAMAIPVMHDSVAGDYLRPKDAFARIWELDKLHARGNNWALESIAAPMAWGCSTGDAATRIAVIDAAFHQVDDVTAMHFEHYAASYEGPIVLENEHGNAVASIIAARGNNDSGSTGVMWKSDLRLWDLSRSIAEVTVISPLFTTQLRKDNLLRTFIRMRRAVDDGARVINVSSGLLMPDDSRIPDTPGGRRYLEMRVRPAMRWVLERRNGQPNAPLFVFSAGNGDALGVGRDASLNGFPIIQRDFPGRVLVVAATEADGSRAQIRDNSNFGELVTISAPGERVMAIDHRNNFLGFPGTSAAAPLVAGVAGLLFSFDPKLTAEDVSRLIVEGARRGGLRSASRRAPNDSIPYLNAYEALKLAAQRPGAPLCGNRVWNDGNNNIVVERDSLTAETIITRDPADHAAFVNPHHGGKRIDLGFSYRYDWDRDSRSFQPVAFTQPNLSDVSGAWLSYTYVADHDNVMWAERIDTLDATGQVSRLRLLRTSDRSVVVDFPSQHLPGTALPPPLVCIMLFPVSHSGQAAPFVQVDQFDNRYECAGFGRVGAWDSAPSTVPPAGETNPTPILGSVAPQGDAVFVPVSIRHLDVQRTDFFEVGRCSAFDADTTYRFYVVRKCSSPIVDTDSATSAMVYRVDTATKQWTVIPLDQYGSTTLANREINSLEVSEDGKEIMISTSQRASHIDLSGASACHDETLEWISIDRSAIPKYSPGKVIKRVSLPQGASCGGMVEAGGTVSPSRTGLGNPGTLAPSSSRPRRRPMFMPLRQQEARHAKATSQSQRR